MSVKQDRSYARTAQDIERKYAFGKTFADMLGLINESRDKVDSVESGLRDEITKTETYLRRNTEEIVAGAKKEMTTTINGVTAEVTQLNEWKLTAEGTFNTVQESIKTANESIDKLNEFKVTAEGTFNTITERIDGVDEDIEKLASLQVTTDGIRGIVAEETKGIEEDIEKLTEMQVTANGVSFLVSQQLSNGVDTVKTTNGYVFGTDGLDISNSGSEIKNKIDHTGMYVSKMGNDVLVANNNGVEATDLHAKTYLKIGKNDGRSRFEDYSIDRTACFWIGG
jgi:chromosome segregation ATPase